MLGQRVILLIFLICRFGIIQAQELVFNNINGEDGLPSSEVYHSIQDSKGYMWFATDRGVARYDGYEFEVFTTEEGLADNVIFELFEDYKGRIWFVSYSLKFSYYENGVIKPYKYNNVIQSYKNTLGIKSSFVVDDQDNVHLGTASSGSLIISKTGEVTRNNTQGSHVQIHLSQVGKHTFHYAVITSEKVTWEYLNAAYQDIEFWYNNFTKTMIRFKKNGIKSKQIFAKNPNRCRYFSILGKIYEIPKNGIPNLFYNTSDNIIYLYETDRFLWVGTQKNGGYCINKKTHQLEHSFLANKSVSSINKDREGGYWVTTLENGIYYTPNLYNSTFSIGETMDEKYIIEITGNENDEVLVANRNNSLKLFKNEGLKYSNDELGEYPTQISYMTYSQQFKSYIISSTDIVLYQDNEINMLYENISTRDFVYKTKDSAFTCMRTVQSITSNHLIQYMEFSGCQCIEEVSTDRVLIGGLAGLYELVSDSILFIGQSSKLLQERIVDIQEHPNGNIVLGTRGAGVVFIKNDKVFNIGKHEGLLSNQVKSMHIDQDENIWVATNKGLSIIYDIEKRQIRNFTTNHGLLSNEVNSIYVSQNKAWVGTKKGLNIIKLELFESVKKTSKVIVKSVKTSDSLHQPGSVLKEVKLDYHSSFLEVKFVALNYRSQGDIQYKYRLKGLNDDWIETNSNVVQLLSIPSGDYTFQVLASNEDGLWGSDPTEIFLSVSYPFWKTWWFYLLNALFIGSLVSFYYLLRLRRMRERVKLNSEIRNYQQQAFSAQMNPHFIFNSLNSIQSFIIKNDKRESNRYLAKFAKLMRLVLANSQSAKVKLSDELLALGLYLDLESIRFGDRLEYSIMIDPSLEQDKVQIPTLLIQPYVENAIWHGIMHKDSVGKVEVKVEKKDNQIICTIRDNGVGREASANMKKDKSHKSMSSGITEKRLKILASEYESQFDLEIIDLEDENQKKSGTLVRFSIPYILGKADD